MDHLDRTEPLQGSGVIGVSWASSGGESAALLNDKYLAADGVENVIRVLEELEDEHIRELEFIELNACSGGCVGGVLTVEKPVCRARAAAAAPALSAGVAQTTWKRAACRIPCTGSPSWNTRRCSSFPTTWRRRCA